MHQRINHLIYDHTQLNCGIIKHENWQYIPSFQLDLTQYRIDFIINSGTLIPDCATIYRSQPFNFQLRNNLYNVFVMFKVKILSYNERD